MKVNIECFLVAETHACRPVCAARDDGAVGVGACGGDGGGGGGARMGGCGTQPRMAPQATCSHWPAGTGTGASRT
eukprot:2515527-Pleurochrysis_carterae.AAC.1